MNQKNDEANECEKFEEIGERRRVIALFRYSIIAGLEMEGLGKGDLSARIAELAGRRWKLPNGNGKEHVFTERTLWNWWTHYKKNGLMGLVPELKRVESKKITPDVLSAAIQARKDVPSRSTTYLIRNLELQKLVPVGLIKRSTLDRYLEAAGASRRRMKSLGDKRYTRLLFERPNEFWVGDYHEAPILWVPASPFNRIRERYKTVHMCAFIDHYSKFVPHAQWYTNERIATLEDTFKRSLLKRGLCSKIYVDRGAVYRSDDFAFALAYLKIKLVHSKPYKSEGRGCIERFNRTIVDGFEPEARASRIEDLGKLNQFFEAWLALNYHSVIHSSTGQTPLDRFASDEFVPCFPDPVFIQDTFRVREKRKVHPKTATVEVDGIYFQCENFLRGRWVEVLYDPHSLEDVLILLKGKRVQRAFPQKVNDPQPTPERPIATPPAFDYLAALRAEYDRRIALQARHLSLSDFKPNPEFDLTAFLVICSQMLDKELTPYEKEELSLCFQGVGPFSEKTTRLALEHALRLRGRELHISVYTQYLKEFHLAVLKANNPEQENS